MTIREPEPKTQVSILRKACPGLKQQQAYDVLATLKGYTDWNTMSAALNQVVKLIPYRFTLKGDGEWFDLSFNLANQVGFDESVAVLTEAITKWVETTPTGSDLYSEHGDALSFEELQSALSSTLDLAEFNKFLASQGIVDFVFNCVATQGSADLSVFDSCCGDPDFTKLGQASSPNGYPHCVHFKGNGETLELSFNYPQPISTSEVLETIADALTAWKRTPVGAACLALKATSTFAKLYQVLVSGSPAATDLPKFMAVCDVWNFKLKAIPWDGGVELLASEPCFDVQTNPESVALVDVRSRVAGEAYSNFDFGPYQVEETSGWEHWTGGSEWSRMVFVRHESADPEADTTTQIFSVEFKQDSAEIVTMGTENSQKAGSTSVVQKVDGIWTFPYNLVAKHSCYPVEVESVDEYGEIAHSAIVYVVHKRSPHPSASKIEKLAKTHYCEEIQDTRIASYSVTAAIVDDDLDAPEFSGVLALSPEGHYIGVDLEADNGGKLMILEARSDTSTFEIKKQLKAMANTVLFVL